MDPRVGGQDGSVKTELDINKRWEAGTPHHPKSEALYKLIDAIDFKLNGDSLGLTAGGDGDNGESLMYALDIVHDAEDNDELVQLKQHLKVK